MTPVTLHPNIIRTVGRDILRSYAIQDKSSDNEVIMTVTQPINKTIIAFDVAKEKLDICSDDALKTPPVINNTIPAIRKVLISAKRQSKKQGLPELFVIVESTGTYERKILDLCVTLDIDCHRAPCQ